jgi:hypothetical protein
MYFLPSVMEGYMQLQLRFKLLYVHNTEKCDKYKFERTVWISVILRMHWFLATLVSALIQPSYFTAWFLKLWYVYYHRYGNCDICTATGMLWYVYHHLYPNCDMCTTTVTPPVICVPPPVHQLWYVYHHWYTNCDMCNTTSTPTLIYVPPQLHQPWYVYHHRYANCDMCTTTGTLTVIFVPPPVR